MNRLTKPPPCHIYNTEEVSREAGTFGAITSPDQLWPDAILYYEYREGDFTEEEKATIQAAMDDMELSTTTNGNVTCVKILPRPSSNYADYVDIHNGNHCGSAVGMIGGDQLMSLDSPCLDWHGLILHELLHAFGFYHEFSRPDRDDFVEVLWENIQEGAEKNFEKYNASEAQCFGVTYDYDSSTHYQSHAFSANGEPTMVPLDEYAKIGQFSHLSTKDIEGLQLLYGCKAKEDTVYFRDAVGDCPGSQVPLGR